MKTFDPNLPGVATGGYFALPFTKEEAHTVLLSVPWDVTTSYRPGTHLGPQAIIDASTPSRSFQHTRTASLEYSYSHRADS